MEHELGLTALFNDHLAGLANSLLALFHIVAKEPARPWQNWVVMELLVAVLLMVTVAILRAGLSADKPGGLQHIFELVYGVIKTTVHDVGIHGDAYTPYIATIAIFILSMNLIGLVPTLESPTATPSVPAGLAIATFLYFNAMGFKANGLGYLGHFAGPVRFSNPIANIAIMAFMLPIETMSIFIRPLSLTVRLYGNIFAGDQVTNVFIEVTKIGFPVLMMILHIFVAFVQAYVFMLLTTIYIAGSTAGHDSHDLVEQM